MCQDRRSSVPGHVYARKQNAVGLLGHLCRPAPVQLVLDVDQVRLDKGRPFSRAIMRIFDATFPFDHGPSVIVDFRKLAEHSTEINVAIT